MSDIFNESLTKLKPMYYHLLDGYLNPDSGSDQNVVIDLFKNNRKILDDGYDINLLLIKHDRFIFYNLKTHEINPVSISELKPDMFKYCIYKTSSDNHGTTILFRIHNGKLYINTFNSGDGIDLNSNPKFINGIECYTPYKSFTINSDFIYTIKSICNINILYNIFVSKNHLTKLKTEIYMLDSYFSDFIDKIKDFFPILDINEIISFIYAGIH
jgi:hypothetical protein